MRFPLILVMTSALAIVGCGDGGGGTAGTGGSGATGGSGGSGAAGGAGGGTGATGGMGGSGGMGGGGGGSAAAKAFCTRYEPTCSFGPGRYADRDDCIAMYDSFSGAKQTCVEDHLTNAEGGMTDLHCGHATGETICDLD